MLGRFGCSFPRGHVYFSRSVEGVAILSMLYSVRKPFEYLLLKNSIDLSMANYSKQPSEFSDFGAFVASLIRWMLDLGRSLLQSYYQKMSICSAC